MKKFIVNVLDEATQTTKESIFDILTFALRNEIVSVEEVSLPARQSHHGEWCTCGNCNNPNILKTDITK